MVSFMMTMACVRICYTCVTANLLNWIHFANIECVCVRAKHHTNDVVTMRRFWKTLSVSSVKHEFVTHTHARTRTHIHNWKPNSVWCSMAKWKNKMWNQRAFTHINNEIAIIYDALFIRLPAHSRTRSLCFIAKNQHEERMKLSLAAAAEMISYTVVVCDTVWLSV